MVCPVPGVIRLTKSHGCANNPWRKALEHESDAAVFVGSRAPAARSIQSQACFRPPKAPIETRTPASEETSGPRHRPDLKVGKVARFNSGSGGETVSSPGILGHYAAPDRGHGRDQ